MTSAYVDTQSRIGTMRASIDRLRALMGQTTGIDQIVRLETELSQRQADLESLEAKLANLDKQVTMSTVVVTLTSAGAGAVTTPEETGFVAGLRSGWRAFTGFFVGLLTVVGAVLPFLATLALLALPGFIWWRRRPRSGRQPAGAFAGFGPAAPEPERGAVTEPDGQAEAAHRPAAASAAPESTISEATGSPTTQPSTTQPSTTDPSTPGASSQTGRTQSGETL